MKQLFFVISLLLLCTGNLLSQTVLMDREVSGPYARQKNWGRNRANMIMPHVQLQWAIGPEKNGAEIAIGPSYNFRAGVSYKRRINGWLSVGPTLQYSTERFVMRQTTHKTVPDSILHEREWFNLQGMVGGGFVRFNFRARRGNTYGTFAEIGGHFVFIPRFTHVTLETLPGGEVQEIRTQNLSYTLRSYGEAYIKLGWMHFSFVTSYRFTPLFKPNSGLPDLPPVKVGLQVTY